MGGWRWKPQQVLYVLCGRNGASDGHWDWHVHVNSLRSNELVSSFTIQQLIITFSCVTVTVEVEVGSAIGFASPSTHHQSYDDSQYSPAHDLYFGVSQNLLQLQVLQS